MSVLYSYINVSREYTDKCEIGLCYKVDTTRIIQRKQSHIQGLRDCTADQGNFFDLRLRFSLFCASTLVGQNSKTGSICTSNRMVWRGITD